MSFTKLSSASNSDEEEEIKDPVFESNKRYSNEPSTASPKDKNKLKCIKNIEDKTPCWLSLELRYHLFIFDHILGV